MACSRLRWTRYGEGRRRRKHHEPRPQEGLDDPFGPPPEASLARGPVWGEELVVQEALREVASGAAKLRGEYTGGRPTMGCPGGHGETRVSIAQEPESAQRVLA